MYSVDPCLGHRVLLFKFKSQENGLLTYAMAAKSGEGVNLCFQKIAAELLGIRYKNVYQYFHANIIY